MAELERFVQLFATGVQRVDSRAPVAASARSGNSYRPGIGPFGEDATVSMVLDEIDTQLGVGYQRGVRYPSDLRKKCDLCLGEPPNWELALEMKLLRVMGDNGKTNDSILTHILSPYRQNRSAFTDCKKLAQSEFCCPKAIVIYGYDYDEWPIELAIAAFERLASDWLGQRVSAEFDGLVHPVHQRGAVHGWLLNDGRADEPSEPPE